MQRQSSQRHIVLIGGGHSHVYLLKKAGESPLQDTLRANHIDMTLISPDAWTPYSGMLPGYVAGHYTKEEMHIDLSELCAWSGVTFVQGTAIGVDYFGQDVRGTRREGGGGRRRRDGNDDEKDDDEDGNSNGGGGSSRHARSCLGEVHLMGADGVRSSIQYDALGIDVGSSPGGFFAEGIATTAVVEAAAEKTTKMEEMKRIPTDDENDNEGNGGDGHDHDDDDDHDHDHDHDGCNDNDKGKEHRPYSVIPKSITPVKPISTFSDRYEALTSRLLAKNSTGGSSNRGNGSGTNENVSLYTPENPFVLLVVGGGAGGVEIALAAQHSLTKIIMSSSSSSTDSYSSSPTEPKRGTRIKKMAKRDTTQATQYYSPSPLKVVLATRGTELLEGYPTKVRKVFARIMKERGMEVRYNVEAVGVRPPINSGGGGGGGDSDGGDDGVTEGRKQRQKQVQGHEHEHEHEHGQATSRERCNYNDQMSTLLLFDLAADSSPPASSSSSPLTPAFGSSPLRFHECLWCTSARAPAFLASSTPFPCTTDDDNDDDDDGNDNDDDNDKRGRKGEGGGGGGKKGFLLVHDTYQCLDHPGVFASGDCCHMPSHPRPKAGVFAVRAGPVVAENIVNYLLNEPLRKHVPQKNFLSLISTGDQYAVLSRGRHVALEGSIWWKLKDRIDRGWMATYQTLPPR